MVSLLGGCGSGEEGSVGEPPGGSAQTVTIDPSVTFQTISGWEAHAQSGHEHPSFPLFREELFDRAVAEAGINRIRLEAWSGEEARTDWYGLWRSGQIDEATWRCNRFATDNDNDDPFTIDWTGFLFSQLDSLVQNTVLPMKQRLEARGESLFLNVTYDAFVRQICDEGDRYVHDDSPEEYAEFVLATHLHLRDKYGLVPDAWEAILEPDNTPFWRGRQIGDAVVAAARRLRANGFSTRFVAPSNSNMSRAIDYFDDMVQVPDARSELLALSYHRYGGVSEANLRSIAQRGTDLGIETAMLEHIGSGQEDLHDDLVLGRVSAWQQFALAFPSQEDIGGHYYNIDVSDPGSPRVNIGRRTKFLAQYFRYVRRGAVRLEARSRDPAFSPVAFRNVNGRVVVVVRAARAGEVSVGGLPAGPYGINYATEDEYNVEGPSRQVGSSGTLSASIPDSGVLTVYGK